MYPRRALPLRLLWLLLFGAACRDGSPPAGPETKEAAPPAAISVTADRKDLVYTYVAGAAREFRTATAIAEIPEDARRQVIVTDLSLSPEQRQSGRYIFLADLRTARPDGTYPVALASRYGFEAKLTGTSTDAVGQDSVHQVVVYSTSWCGVCKKTKRLLQSLKVPFVEKDIEASRSAAEELSRKSAASGINPGGVPVIDVAGVLLQGLDEPTLRAALEAKGFL